MNSEPREPGRATPDDALLRLYERTRSGEPPPSVDAAILARARAAVAPARTPRRWWIPASIAATALIALSVVVEVDRQTGPVTAPRFDEARQLEKRDTEAAEAAPTPPAAPTADATLPAPVPAESAPSKPPVPAPAGEAALPTPSPQPTPGALRERSQPATPDLQSMRAAPAAVSAGQAEADAAIPTPEQWLARIEALEAQGRDTEAARERAALEAAYPGWLERHSSTPQ